MIVAIFFYKSYHSFFKYLLKNIRWIICSKTLLLLPNYPTRLYYYLSYSYLYYYLTILNIWAHFKMEKICDVKNTIFKLCG